MLLICNKHIKKLFFTLLASGAIAGHSDFTAGNLKIFSLSDVSFNRTDQRILKFDNLAAAEAEQVVVFGRGFYLIVVVSFIEMKLLY